MKQCHGDYHSTTYPNQEFHAKNHQFMDNSKKIDHHFSNFDKMVKSILAWRKLT
ncbi:hypothetical protein LguiA_022497 [Lonicera macranthoides]